MLRRNLPAVLSLTIGIALALGCSSGDSPLAPPSTAGNNPTAASNGSASGVSSHMLWGMWHIDIDPATMVAEVTPVRGAEFTCNVTQFMQPPSSPTNMVSIAVDVGASVIEDGFFVVDVSLRHPFPGMNQFNGFDVRGILLSYGSVVGEHDTSVIMAGEGETRLMNPDGYTRFWNWPEFTTPGIFGYTHGMLAPPNQPTATINGYKYFADGLGSDDPVASLDPATRGFFATEPGVNTRRYEIQFKMESDKPVFDFDYAVDAGWESPDVSFAPEYPIDAFPITANCAEAFNLSVVDAGSTAYYVDPDTKGGELVLDIEIWDHQGAVSPSGVPGEIASIWLEGDVLYAPVDVLPTATVLPGSSVASSVFKVTLADLDLTESGTTEFFITVESSDPNTYQPQISGGELFDYPDAPLAAYFKGRAQIDDKSPQVDEPPTIPVLIDPDHQVMVTHFAIDAEGVIHGLYTDGTDIFWSWSDDLGWNWTNEGSIYAVSNPSYVIRSNDLQMDADSGHVYALFCQYDGPTSGYYCEMLAARLDIADYDAGWEIISVWRQDTGYDVRHNYHGPQFTVLNDGSIMVYAMRYHGTGAFDPTYYYASSWENLENAPEVSFDTHISNGYTVYTYSRYTIAMVHDSGDEIFYAIGGRFNDYNSLNGMGTDHGNAILKYDKSSDMWAFVQTSDHPASSNYWDTVARGLAIDQDDNLHWVFEYSYDNCGSYGDWGGHWVLAYGTAPSSADHTGMVYDDPINETSHHAYVACPGYANARYDTEWLHTSIGADLDGGVVIAYQRSVNDCSLYCIRDDGAGWSDPPVEIDGDLYGYAPYGRMHPTGWYMMTFTDRNHFGSGSDLPYFVAWK